MKVFITGASGFIGSAVVAELLGAGHQVLGLARSEKAAANIRAMGAEVHRGALEDMDSLRMGVQMADGVIHLAFNPDRANFAEVSALDGRAIEAIGAQLIGTDKPLLVPNGLAGIVHGRAVTEGDDIPEHYPFPRVSEQTALRLASQGVNATVIRLAQVHDKVKQGFVTALVDLARASGKSTYVGDGAHRWPAVHIADVARLFRRVLEAPTAGAKFHAVAEEGIALRAIAETIGAALGVPVVSVAERAASAHFGPLYSFVSQDMPATARATTAAMQWHPTGPELLTDLRQVTSVPAT